MAEAEAADGAEVLDSRAAESGFQAAVVEAEGIPGGGGGIPGRWYPAVEAAAIRADRMEAILHQPAPMNLTIRWDSALPVQQALMRRAAGETDELKAVTDAAEKYYVVSIHGFRLPRPRNRSNDTDDQTSDEDDNNRGRNRNTDALRSQLLDAAQLAPKGRSSIYAKDVQIDGFDGSGSIRFLFPRTNPISADDKEVDFILEVRRIKVEEKFKLSDMHYEGKLAL